MMTRTRSTVRSTLDPELEQALVACAKDLAQRFSAQLTVRGVGKRAVRVFQNALMPSRRSGRPRSKMVTTALQMLTAGKRWKEIYPAAIPGYESLDFAHRSYRSLNLRRAVKAARKRSLGPKG